MVSQLKYVAEVTPAPIPQVHISVLHFVYSFRDIQLLIILTEKQRHTHTHTYTQLGSNLCQGQSSINALKKEMGLWGNSLGY